MKVQTNQTSLNTKTQEKFICDDCKSVKTDEWIIQYILMEQYYGRGTRI